MSNRPIESRLRFLERYAIVTTTVIAIVGCTAFLQSSGQPQKARFTEIDVERINVLEPNGHYRMVISNAPRSIGPIYKGKPFGYPGGTRPGIIFFNDEGTENGGLTFGGRRDSTGRFRGSGHLSFDQYDQDQVVYLQYQDNNGTRRMGLTVADRADVNIYDLVLARDSIMTMPAGAARDSALARLLGPRNGVPMFAPRGFFGRDPAKSALVTLADPNGKVRLRMIVDSLGVPAIEFLDAAGQVKRRLGEQ
jgi:hypothetical protein